MAMDNKLLLEVLSQLQVMVESLKKLIQSRDDSSQMAIQDKAAMSDRVFIELVGPDGEVKQRASSLPIQEDVDDSK